MPSTPNLSGLERKRLKLLQQSLADGLDPEFAGSEIDSILSGAQTRVANRQAQMAPITDALLQQAQMGGSSAGASALTNAYSAINPGVAGPGAQAKLGAFNQALYPQEGQASPIYTPQPGASTAPTALDAEDLAGIDALLQPMIGATNVQTGFPYGLHEATMEIIQRFRALSYPEPVIQQAQQYIAQRWAQLGGPTS